jgi:antitoxin component YwqK of YwqJK toxin-antitoxin module
MNIRSNVMKPLITIFISILFISTCFAQQDLLPAYPREISYKGDIAYYNGSPFTGILVDEKNPKIKWGEFKNGYKNGMFREYYPNGKKKAEGKYTNGVKEDKHTEWFENKQEKSSCTYNNGNIIDGKYVTYLENGQKEKEETYKSGRIKILGKYEDGKLSELLEASAEFYANGQKKSEGWLKNGKKEGLWAFWFEEGQKESEGNYKDGNEEGQWISWFRNGEEESRGNYKNGKNEGLWSFWYNRGPKKSEGNYKDGNEEGQWISWFEDGSKEFEGNFKNGLKDGQGISYENGLKVYDGEWKNGKMNGKGSFNYINNYGIIICIIGYFVNDELEGQATLTKKQPDGTTSTFTGQLSDWHYSNGILIVNYYNGILYNNFFTGNKSTTEYKDGIAGKEIYK